MLVKEYRICMPLTVEEYKIGQLYMIAKHSFEETHSGDGEGIEFVVNEPCEAEEHGRGQYTEKRAYLNSKLGPWLGPMVSKVFFVTEKSWNFYPYTKTEYHCSFIPRFAIRVETVYRNDNGREPNALKLSRDVLAVREVDVIDIADDKQMPQNKLSHLSNLRTFKSEKTQRGPLEADWMKTSNPIMCSYKIVEVSFDVWGIGGTIETHVHQGIRDLLAVGHREAFAWIDSWFGMDEAGVRTYEEDMRAKMNAKIAGTAKKVAEAEARGEVKAMDPPPNLMRRMSTGVNQLCSSLSGSFSSLWSSKDKDKR